MRTRLEVGDIVTVHNALSDPREYSVTKIEGNKAFTGFRNFNCKIWHEIYVYEFGKTTDSQWDNVYRVDTSPEGSQT